MKRPFRGLRDREPRERYDAVVVGAGVGGLVLANLLAREGLSVLLVEQHYMVGGYCSTFRRAGYTFDAATHFYPLLGNPETLTGRLLAELGVETRWVRMDPVDTFHFPDGSRFEVPADFATYRARLDAEFPHQREALERFFAEVRETYMLGLLEYFRDRPTPRLDPYRHLTLRDALDRHFQDPKLKLLLTADCPHWGSAPSRTSFVFDSMLRLSYFLGNYYPVGGSQAFADELARVFEERGGEILMSSWVERIVVAGGRATGIEVTTDRGRLQGRRRVAAEAVISNADLGVTARQLLAGEAAGAELTAAADGLEPSFPCFLTHVGLRGVPHETLERVQGYYWNGWDPDLVGRGGLRCKIFSPTVYEPAMAPEGGQVVILQKVLEMDYDRVADWAAHKQEIEDHVFAHLASVVPGIEEHVVVRLSASAATAQRFTANRAGAMLGWTMSPDQLGAARPDIDTPLPNLWLVGHWVRPGGGITPVIVSAMRTARAVLAARPAELTAAAGPIPHPSRGGGS